MCRQPVADQLTAINIAPYPDSAFDLNVRQQAFGTCLQHALLHWQELCCSNDFNSFAAKASIRCLSLPQLILHKKEVMGALLNGIRSGKCYSLEALFHCLVAIAKDLGASFVTYFPLSVEAITCCLEGTMELDANRVESAFRCLATLCTLLWRSGKVTMLHILECTRHIRNHPKQHVRKLAAQAVAPAVRSSTNEIILASVRNLIMEHSILCESTQQEHRIEATTFMLHYIAVGHASALHSKSDSVLRAVFDPDFVPEVRGTVRLVIVQNLLVSLDASLPKSAFKELWNSFLHVISSCAAQVGNKNISEVMYLSEIAISICSTRFELCTDSYNKLSDFVHAYFLFCTTSAKPVEQSSVTTFVRLLAALSSRNEFKAMPVLTSFPWCDLIRTIDNSSITLILRVLIQNIELGCVTAHYMSEALLIDSSHLIFLRGFENSLMLGKIIQKVAEFSKDLHSKLMRIDDALLKWHFECKLTSLDFSEIWSTLQILPYFADTRLVQSVITTMVSYVKRSKEASVDQNALSSGASALLMSSLEADILCRELDTSSNCKFSFELIRFTLSCRISSPAVWSSLARLTSLIIRRADEIPAELMPSDLTECIRSQNRLLRVSVLEYLAIIANNHMGMSPKSTECVTAFLYMNRLSRDSGSILEYSRKSINLIRSLTRKLSDFDASDHVAVLNMALGALYLRFNPLWDPLVELIGVLSGSDSTALQLLQAEILRTKQEVIADHDVQETIILFPTDSDQTRDEVCEALNPQERSVEQSQRLQLLITSLQYCTLMDQTFVLDLFLDVYSVCRRNEYRYVATRYSGIILALLKLMQSKDEVRSLLLRTKLDAHQLYEGVFTALKALVGDDNANLASEALKCMGLLKLDYLPNIRVSQLCLLTDVQSVKRALTSIQFEEGSEDSEVSHEFPKIQERHREDVISIIVSILSKYILSGKTSFSSLKSIILRWFSCLRCAEMEPFIHGLFVPLMRPHEIRLRHGTTVFSTQAINSAISEASHGTLIALMSQLREVHKAVPMHLRNSTDLILSVMFQIFMRACKRQDIQNDELLRLKILRSNSLRMIARIIPIVKFEGIERHWLDASECLINTVKGLENECSGSQEPAVLCLLSSITQRVDLIKLLETPTGHKLLEYVFAVLSSPKTSEPCRRTILSMITMLLNSVNSELGNDCTVANLSEKIAAGVRMSLINELKRGRIPTSKQFGEDILSEIQILEQLSKFERCSPWNICMFKDVLEMACTKRLNSGKRTELLVMLNSILSALSLDEQLRRESVERLAFLYATLRAPCSRRALLDLFKALDYSQDGYRVRILHDLNAYLDGRIGEVDHGRRIRAYAKLQSRWGGEDETSMQLWIYNSLHDICSNDSILRNSAKLLIYRCLEVGSTASYNFQHGPSSRLVVNTVLPWVAELLGRRDPLIRNCGIELLRYAVVRGYILDFCCLCDQNEEVDVFLNLCHIQSHRRARAIRQLHAPEVLSSVEPRLYWTYVIPLFMVFLGDPSADVAATAVDALGHTVKILESAEYVKVICRLLHLAHRASELQKFHLRGATCMLENLRTHYEPYGDFDDRLVRRGEAADLGALYSTALPLAQACITLRRDAQSSEQGSSQYLQTSAISCVSSMLALFDHEKSEAGTLCMLKFIIENMSSRSEKLRDNAMTALKFISIKLGERHLPLIIRVLRNGRTTGFHLHVLGKAIHVLVSNCVNMSPEIATVVFVEIVPTLQANLFGSARDRMDSKSTKPVAEAKPSYSLKTISLIAALLKDGDSLIKFVRTFVRMLPESPDSRSQKNFELILHALHEGLLRNASLGVQNLTYLAGSLVEEYITSSTVDTDCDTDTSLLASEYCVKIHQFAISLLYDALKCAEKLRDERLPCESDLEALKTTIALMMRCLLSTSYEVQVGATRILAKLLRSGLLAKEISAENLTKRIIRTLKSCKSVKDHLAQNCLKILAHIMKTHHQITLTLPQVSFVLSFSFKNLSDDAQDLKNSFLLLNSLISRRVVQNDMYALMHELLLTIAKGQSMQVRSMCSHVFIRFVLSYPIGERKVEDMLRTLISSLEYPQADGRMSVLSTIHALLLKLPEVALKSNGPLFFFPLVLRVASDTHSQCSELANRALDCLFSRVDETQMMKFLSCTIVWSKRQDMLQRAAYQVLLLGFSRHASITFEVYSQVEGHMIKRIRAALQRKDGVDWSITYCQLICFERAVSHRSQCLDSEHSDAFSSEADFAMVHILPHAVSYDHLWIQASALRVLRSYLQAETRMEKSFTILSDVNIELIVDALITVIERQSRTKKVEHANMGDVLLCLTAIMTSVHAKAISEKYSSQIFHRLHKSAFSSPELKRTILQSMAALVSANKSPIDSSNMVLYHALLLSYHCMDRTIEGCDTKEDLQSYAIAGDIFSSLQLILPPEIFLVMFERVKTDLTKKGRSGTVIS